MSAGNVTNNSKAGYLQRNWFKIAIAAFLVFILVKKDLTFSINMRAPAQQRQEEPVQKTKKERVEERLTDVKGVAEQSETNLLDVSSIFSSKKGSAPAIEALQQIDDAKIQAYLKRFARVAASESEKFGIPASVILGNALLQSYAGERAIAQQTNNQFALPCTPDWQGGSKELDGKCFRTYENAWTSFRDHSYYITTGRMSNLKTLKNENYKTWAKALEKADFSNDDNYASQLIQVIEKYQLTKLDE
ncbi:MAG: glucosaminidase domain-containing protein [Saprospiraceae bacterium]